MVEMSSRPEIVSEDAWSMARDQFLEAEKALKLNKTDEVSQQIRRLAEVNDNTGRPNAARQFVRQALQGRV